MYTTKILDAEAALPWLLLRHVASQPKRIPKRGRLGGMGQLAAWMRAGKSAQALLDFPCWQPEDADRRAAERQAEAMACKDILALCAGSQGPLLQRSSTPPPLIFLRGDPKLLGTPGMAMVGARDASNEACAWATSWSQHWAQAGISVISGGARGIDGAAHLGAVSARGKSIVVLGVAIDQTYPAMHRGLFADVLGCGGALLSEHPPTVATRSYDHARRNRLIAALSLAVWVAEARAGSGSLQTAGYARAFGIPVWIAPDACGGHREGLMALHASGQANMALHQPLTHDSNSAS